MVAVELQQQRGDHVHLELAQVVGGVGELAMGFLGQGVPQKP
jgi:hypothetical protein